MKKKSTLLTEAIARAKIKEYENKKADVVVQSIKRNDENGKRQKRVKLNDVVLDDLIKYKINTHG